MKCRPRFAVHRRNVAYVFALDDWHPLAADEVLLAVASETILPASLGAMKILTLSAVAAFERDFFSNRSVRAISNLDVASATYFRSASHLEVQVCPNVTLPTRERNVGGQVSKPKPS